MNYNFNLKLLSGNKVVLVELDGFDAEIFMPVIKNGRIMFENVIGSRRRCCEKDCSANFAKVIKVSTFNVNSNEKKSLQDTDVLLSPPDIIRRCETLAVETPIKIKNETWQSKVSISPINKYKIVQLYRNQTENTPKKLVKLVSLSSVSPLRDIRNSIGQSATSVSLNDNTHPVLYSDSNFATPIHKKPVKLVSLSSKVSPLKFIRSSTIYQPPTPVTLNVSARPVLYSESNCATPIQKKCVKTYERNKNFTKSALKTITKWRKCLTPLKTYSKKQISENVKRNQPSTPRVVPIEDITLPDYARNPTVGIDANALLIIRKKKIIQDAKTNISAKTFKKQLKYTVDLKQEKVFLPRFKTDFYNSIYGRPYELLTNLSRKNVSYKLREMFKNRCVKRNCSPRPNYLKLIGKVPELETKPINSYEIEKLKRLEPRKLNI